VKILDLQDAPKDKRRDFKTPARSKFNTHFKTFRGSPFVSPHVFGGGGAGRKMMMGVAGLHVQELKKFLSVQVIIT